MKIGIANAAAFILPVAAIAMTDAALSKRIAVRAEDGTVRLTGTKRLPL
jgi:hypothetical protein